MTWKHKLIHILGGYVTAKEAIEAVEAKNERRELLTAAVKRLYNTIGADDILHVNEAGQWLLEGKQMEEAFKKILVAEAEQFTKTSLWRVLQMDIKYQANKKMFTTSTDPSQMDVGKSWTYILDAIKTRLNSLSEGKGVFNSKSGK